MDKNSDIASSITEPNLRNWLHKLTKSNSAKRVHVTPDIPEKQLRNATASMGIPAGSHVLVLVDDSLTKSGKRGICVTSDGMYWKKLLGKGSVKFGDVKQFDMNLGFWMTFKINGQEISLDQFSKAEIQPFADFLLNVLGLEQTLAGITKKKAGVKKRSSRVAKKDTEALMRKRPDVRELEAKEDTKGLIEALEDERKKVREAAARALGRIVDKRAVEPLMQILEDESEKVREAAVRALGKIGDANAVEPLTQALKDRDEGVRRNAAEALGKIGDASAVKPLIQTLKDKSSMVRKAAVRALKRFSTERTREAIEEYEEREREAERKRKVKAKELQLVCQKCRHKFILGRNALVVTPEDVLKAFRGPKIFFADGTLRTSGDSIPGNMRFKSPDLVDSCNYSTLELRVIRKQKTEVNGILSALSRGEPRMWICRKCNTTQPYP